MAISPSNFKSSGGVLESIPSRHKLNMPTFFGDYKVGLRGLTSPPSHSAH